MYNQDLALNNQQRLICHKTKPKQTNIIIKEISLPYYLPVARGRIVGLFQFPTICEIQTALSRN